MGAVESTAAVHTTIVAVTAETDGDTAAAVQTAAAAVRTAAAAHHAAMRRRWLHCS